MKAYPADTNADAVILSEYGKSYFEILETASK